MMVKSLETHKQSLGNHAEHLAELLLQTRGLTTIERNFRCKVGEIDLVMLDGKRLVFVEVRYRKNALFGSALDTVTKKKQKKISAAAQYFLMKNPHYRSRPARFDVIGITGDDTQWVTDAFNPI